MTGSISARCAMKEVGGFSGFSGSSRTPIISSSRISTFSPMVSPRKRRASEARGMASSEPTVLRPSRRSVFAASAIDAQRLDGKGLDLLRVVARERPGGAQRGAPARIAHAEAILRQPGLHLRDHALLAAEEMGNAGDVQQDAVGRIGRHPGAVALHPAAQAQQAVHVLLRLMRLGQKFRQLRARIRQPHAAHEAEAARRGIDRDEAQARLAALNQREGQALGAAASGPS